MKRVVLIAGAFTLWVVLGTSCFLATNFIDVRMSSNCETTYTFKNQNGEAKSSTRCFETEDGNVCKDKAKLVRANKVIEKRICKKKEKKNE